MVLYTTHPFKWVPMCIILMTHNLQDDLFYVQSELNLAAHSWDPFNYEISSHQSNRQPNKTNNHANYVLHKCCSLVIKKALNSFHLRHLLPRLLY